MLILTHLRLDRVTLTVLFLAFVFCFASSWADLVAGHELALPALPSSDCTDCWERDAEAFDGSDSFQDNALMTHRPSLRARPYGVLFDDDHSLQETLTSTLSRSTPRPPPAR